MLIGFPRHARRGHFRQLAFALHTQALFVALRIQVVVRVQHQRRAGFVLQILKRQQVEAPFTGQTPFDPLHHLVMFVIQRLAKRFYRPAQRIELKFVRKAGHFRGEGLRRALFIAGAKRPDSQ